MKTADTMGVSGVRPMTLSRRAIGLKAQSIGVQVQTKEQVKQDHAITVLAKEIIKVHGLVAEKYRDLILYVRQHKVDPKLVTIRLLALGFKRSRISEVLKVAEAPANVFQPFAAKQIGFGRALEFARRDGRKIVVTEATTVLGISPKEAKTTLPPVSADTAKPKPYGARMREWAKQLAFHAKHEHSFDFKDSEYRILVQWKNKPRNHNKSRDGH
jgi:hypothetical protein